VFLILLAFLVTLLGLFLSLLKKPVASYREDRTLELGSSLTVSDLVSSVKNGTLVNGEDPVSTDATGETAVFISLRSRLGMLSGETVSFTVLDKTAPVIHAPEEISVLIGETVDLLANVNAVDNSREVLSVSLLGEYDAEKMGVYSLSYVATDKSGNTATKPVTLTIQGNPFLNEGKMIDGIYTTSKGFTMKIEGGICRIDGQIIANKSFSLPKTYHPGGLTQEVEKAFEEMKAAAEKDGFTLSCRSGFRSWATQDYLFDLYTQRDSLEEALTYSARPGHSEHQLGLAMDVVTSDSRVAASPEVAPIMQWLAENAYRYGFVLRYPEGKTDETGYIFEPWHYRYVGVELAEVLYNNGNWITMEDYFGIDSIYRGY